MSMMWVSVGAGVLTNLYGANKQSKDNQAARDQNAALQREQNNAQWTNWLMSKGVAPTSPVSAGQMPAPGGYSAVNTRLPLWANIDVTRPSTSAVRLVKKGTAAPTTRIGGLTRMAPPAPAGTTPAPMLYPAIQ